MAAAVPLPGVAIVVRAGDAVKAATSTDTDGTYRVNVPPGAYDVTAELMGFDTTARSLNVPQEAVAQSCVQTIDFPMALAPRTPRPASAPATPVPGPGAAPQQGRGAVTERTGGTTLRHAQRADAGRGRRGDRRGTRQRGAPAASARVFHRRAHPGAGRQREHGKPRPRDAERPPRCDRPWRVRSRNRRIQPGVRAWRAWRTGGGFGGPGGGRGGPGGRDGGPGSFFIGGRGRSQNAYNLQSNYSFGGSASTVRPTSCSLARRRSSVRTHGRHSV